MKKLFVLLLSVLLFRSNTIILSPCDPCGLMFARLKELLSSKKNQEKIHEIPMQVETLWTRLEAGEFSSWNHFYNELLKSIGDQEIRELKDLVELLLAGCPDRKDDVFHLLEGYSRSYSK